MQQTAGALQALCLLKLPLDNLSNGLRTSPRAARHGTLRSSLCTFCKSLIVALRITLVDHAGKYRQSSVGTLVQANGNTSCLDSVQTASVVTQTVFMAPDTGSAAPASNNLDNKSLLIVAVVFGVLFFAAMSGLVYLWSRVRQMRRLRQVGQERFPLADDNSSIYDASSTHPGSEYAAAGAMRSRHPSTAAASQRMSYRDANGPVVMSGAQHSRRISNASEMASLTESPNPTTPYPGDDFDTQTPRSAGRHAFE